MLLYLLSVLVLLPLAVVPACLLNYLKLLLRLWILVYLPLLQKVQMLQLPIVSRPCIQTIWLLLAWSLLQQHLLLNFLRLLNPYLPLTLLILTSFTIQRRNLIRLPSQRLSHCHLSVVVDQAMVYLWSRINFIVKIVCSLIRIVNIVRRILKRFPQLVTFFHIAPLLSCLQIVYLLLYLLTVLFLIYLHIALQVFRYTVLAKFMACHWFLYPFKFLFFFNTVVDSARFQLIDIVSWLKNDFFQWSHFWIIILSGSQVMLTVFWSLMY